MPGDITLKDFLEKSKDEQNYLAQGLKIKILQVTDNGIACEKLNKKGES